MRRDTYAQTHRNTHKHTCTRVDIFSQLHCSLHLAHLHIRGSRTHYQLGEMKHAHEGRRTRGGGRRSGEKRKMSDAEAGCLTQPSHLHITTMRGWNLNSLGLTPLTPPRAAYGVYFTYWRFLNWSDYSLSINNNDVGHMNYIQKQAGDNCILKCFLAFHSAISTTGGTCKYQILRNIIKGMSHLSHLDIFFPFLIDCFIIFRDSLYFGMCPPSSKMNES